MNQEADMARSNQKLAFALLFFTFFIWGSIYVTGKMISDDVPASLVACLRCVTAMIPLYFMSRKHLKTKIDRKDWKYFFLVGALGYFLTVQMIQLGIALTGASMAALINAMTPVAVTILAAIILKEKITPVKCLCLVLALAGTIVITSGASTQGETMGIAVVLVGVVSFAAASVYMRRLTAKYPAVLVTTYSMAISLIFHIPVGIVTVCTRPVYDYSAWSGNNPVSWICGLRCGAVYLDKMSVHAACQHLFPVLPITACFCSSFRSLAFGRNLYPCIFHRIDADFS